MSRYNDIPIEFSNSIYDETEYDIITEDYDDGIIDLTLDRIPEAGFLISYSNDEIYPASRRLGREDMMRVAHLDKDIDTKDITAISASVNDKEIKTSRSGNSLILSDTNKRSFDTDILVSLEYKIYGIKQSFAINYKTILPFRASYYQEQTTREKDGKNVKMMTNRTTLTFSQPVSGSMLNSILHNTTVPFVIQ